MKQGIAYADASALTKLFVEETGTAELRTLLESIAEVVSSSLARVEVQRALRRAGAAGAVNAEAKQFFRQIHLHRPNEAVLDRAEVLRPTSLRSLDALHLATALDFSPLPDFFLCYDQRLSEAARDHGLNVLAPGVDEVHEGR